MVRTCSMHDKDEKFVQPKRKTPFWRPRCRQEDKNITVIVKIEFLKEV